MSSASIPFQQRAKLSTGAGAAIAPSPTLQAASVVAATGSSMSKFGKPAKWAIMGTTALAIGAAAAVQFKSDNEARTTKAKQADLERDKQYQQLLSAYGSGESLDDLQNAVSSYGGPQSRG